MARDVFAAGSVALFAADTQHHAGLAVPVDWRRKPVEITCVTFETPRNNRLVEMRRPVGIARTVHPTVGVTPVRHGQLEKLISLPKQVTLALAWNAGHNINAFGARNRLARSRFFNRALEVSIFVGGHLEMQIRVCN